MVQRKLQKLCYYAQAWHLAFTGEKLFPNDFEAWAHGPVCRELWNTFKDFGFNDIQQNFYGDMPQITNQTTLNVLDEVWRVYGAATAFALENNTHHEDPWIKARNGLPELAPSTTKMDNDLIRDYYRSFLTDFGEGCGE